MPVEKTVILFSSLLITFVSVVFYSRTGDVADFFKTMMSLLIIYLLGYLSATLRNFKK